MVFLYNIAIWFYKTGIYIASHFNPKAKLWVNGRKDIFQQLKNTIPKNEKIFWMHCASLGEFEQGRPLLEKIKKEKPSYKILLTFYSPSGFEIRKNYQGADFVFYLPSDSKKNAQQFLNIVNPSIAVFVKYEFWYHYLNELQQRAIPTYLVSAIFRENQIFFKSYGGIFRKMLTMFTHLLVQDKKSKTLLLQNNTLPVTVVGDTRIDRVLDIAQQSKSFPLVDAFVGTSNIMICGSTWPTDEAILIPFFNQKKSNHWKFIIAPHEIDDSHISSIERDLKTSFIRYSDANQIKVTAARVLIINNIGMLSSLYKYGRVAFIGGGFGSGIHNTLEPIAFGLPTIFGKKYKKFEEAKYLVNSGGGFSISNQKELEKVMENLEHEEFYNNTSTKAKTYISQNKGGTQKAFDIIFFEKK